MTDEKKNRDAVEAEIEDTVDQDAGESEPQAGEKHEPTAEEQPGPDGEEQPEPFEEASEVASVGAPSEALPEPEGPAGPESAEESVELVQESTAAGDSAAEEDGGEEQEPEPRIKPAVPGAHLEVDIVPEGVDPLGRSEGYEDLYAIEEEEEVEQVQESDEVEQELTEPIATAAIDLAAGARYRATGKRKTAIARVTLRPGTGTYLINGRALEAHFPRLTLQRNIRQPLETVGYQERMDVIARLGGGGISAQAGALRHGVSRALLEADPNLRGELKRRGFLTRDSRVKERKKAGLKKARKRPQFSKR